MILHIWEATTAKRMPVLSAAELTVAH